MGDIVNLRRFRKQKARADKESRAAENRARHGASRLDKAREKHARDTLARTVDGGKREGRDDAAASDDTS